MATVFFDYNKLENFEKIILKNYWYAWYYNLPWKETDGKSN